MSVYTGSVSDSSNFKLLIVDDHALMRDAISAALRRMYPYSRQQEVCSAAEALAAVESDRWDLVVLDLGLPDAIGFEPLRRLHAMRPAMPILVYSTHPEEKMGQAALAAGASGYLCKTADRAQIGKAVSEMLAGRGYVGDRLRAVLAQREHEAKRRTTVLSAREMEVLLALGRGQSNKEIAACLGLVASSVGTYRARIMEKLSLRTTAGLQRYVVEHRLVHD